MVIASSEECPGCGGLVCVCVKPSLSKSLHGNCKFCGDLIPLGHAALWYADDGTVACCSCENEARDADKLQDHRPDLSEPGFSEGLREVEDDDIEQAWREAALEAHRAIKVMLVGDVTVSLGIKTAINSAQAKLDAARKLEGSL